MPRYWRVGLFLFVGLVVAAGIVWLWLAETINPVPGDEEAAQRRVATALPFGSTREQVKTWLASEGIHYPQNGAAENRSSMMYAEEPYASWLGYYGDVQLEFYFDGDGRLVRRFVSIEIVSL